MPLFLTSAALPNCAAVTIASCRPHRFSVADNLEDMADNASTDATEDALENKADSVRDTAQNQAEDMRTNDPDTNLANGM